MLNQSITASTLAFEAGRAEAAHEHFAIRFMSADGQMEELSREQVRERFGVEHTTRLLFANESLRSQSAPPMEAHELVESERRQSEQEVAQLLASGQLVQSNGLKHWLYGEKVSGGRTADLYLAKVDDHVGLGVFAGSAIEPGELVGEYTGLVRGRCEGASDTTYLFYYDGRSSIDAKEHGNITRWINHSGGRANAHYTDVLVDDVLHVLLVAIKPIAAGQQVLFDYGSSYWFFRQRPVELD